jgi:hypothetical protein
MVLIINKSQLLENVGRLKEYLKQPGVDREFALGLVRLGICLIVTEENGTPIFSPSRFV